MHEHAMASSIGAEAAPKLPFTRAKLSALASGMAGIQLCWAVQVGYVTKELLELGLQPRFVSYAWLAGPIAGVLAQPTVGVLSDRCTSRLGRRRPFLLVGTAVTTVCLLVFAHARGLGAVLGDPPGLHRPRALYVAVVAFWALDFAINSAQGPLRALLADVVPTEQHTVGNAYFALATGIGNGIGSFLGAVPLSRFFTFFPNDVSALYTIASVLLVLTMAATIVFIKETPLQGYSPVAGETDYDSVPGVSPSSQREEQVGFFKAAMVAPSPFFQVFIVQCFSWFGWFTLFVFGTSWVGAEVFNGAFDAAEGTAKRALYDEGVRMGNLGIGLQSVVTIVCALALPSLMRRVSRQAVYLTASVFLAVALSSTILVDHRGQAWIAIALLASTGFSWSVTMTVPWSLMSEAVAKVAPDRAGVYFTMFNLSQCLPEIVVSLVSEEVERISNRQAAVLGLGGVAVFIAAALIVVMKIGKKGSEASARENESMKGDRILRDVRHDEEVGVSQRKSNGQ